MTAEAAHVSKQQDCLAKELAETTATESRGSNHREEDVMRKAVGTTSHLGRDRAPRKEGPFSPPVHQNACPETWEANSQTAASLPPDESTIHSQVVCVHIARFALPSACW